VSARIIIDIITNAGRAAGEIDQTASSFDKFKSGMGSLAGPATAAAGAIGAIGLGAVKAASDMQQASGGVDAVFKTSAGVVHEWAKTSADDVGLAGAAYQTLAAGVGGALTGMGVPLDQATAQTGELITRAADLASVFGGTTQQATEAVTSAFRGEYDSLQRLIPGISDAAIKSEMAAEAANGQTFASEEAAKANAIYNTIMQKSADSAGNFAKEADTAAGAQARAQAKFTDTAAALGEQLLPAVTQVMTWLTALGQWVADHIPLVTTLGAVIGGLAVAVLAVNAAMAVAAAAQSAAAIATGLWSAAAGIGTVATTAFGVAMAVLTSPITLVIAAIAAVIAIVYLLVKNWDTVAETAKTCWDAVAGAAGAAFDWIKSVAGAALDWLSAQWSQFADFVSGVWDGLKTAAAVVWEFIKYAALGPIGAILFVLKQFGIDTEDIFNAIKKIGTSIWDFIKSAATTAMNAIMAPINAVKTAIDKVIDALKSALNWVKNLAGKIPFIGGLFGGSTQSAPTAGLAGRYWSTATGAPSARGLGLGARSVAGGAGGGITINVSGAIDPVAVAQQINRILTGQARRFTGVHV
jgi:hypothetical protein